MMKPSDYQKEVLRTANHVSLKNAALGLCGESGEVADLIKKYSYQCHELDVEHMIKELGDVLWYLTLMTEALDCTLDDVMTANVHKLRKRYPNGFKAVNSTNRKDGDI